MIEQLNEPTNLFCCKGKKYITKLIGHFSKGEFYNPQGDFASGICAFKIFDELQENLLGGVMFTVAPLVSAIANNFQTPIKIKFKDTDRTAEVFTNLLEYLHFDDEKIMPNFPSTTIFEYRFQNHLPEELQKDLNLYLLDAKDGIDKCIRKIVLGSDINNENIIERMKTALKNKYEINQNVGLSEETFSGMVGINSPVIQKNMRVLVELGFAKITSETDQEGIISIKYNPAYEFNGKGGVSTLIQDNRKYTKIHTGPVSAKGGSTVILYNEGDITQEFNNLIKNIDSLDDLDNPKKIEVKKLVKELEQEVNQGKDENKVVTLIKKITGISKKVFDLITNNPVTGPLVTYYLSKALGVNLQ